MKEITIINWNNQMSYMDILYILIADKSLNLVSLNPKELILTTNEAGAINIFVILKMKRILYQINNDGTININRITNTADLLNKFS